MIKLFRKIRQKMLVENKFSKYLLYALGEIILVVIGILIAVAINNSQQQKITLKKEQTYLKGLQQEFITSQRKLNELLEVNKQNYVGVKTILETISNPTVSLNEKQFSELLFRSFSSDISFNANNSLLNEIINSGSLKDIANDTLRVLLTNWESTLEDVARQEQELGVQRVRVLDMFRTNEYSIKTIFEQTNPNSELNYHKADSNVSNLNLVKSMEVENNMWMFYLTSKATETSHYTPLMNELNSILALLETEIK